MTCSSRARTDIHPSRPPPGQSCGREQPRQLVTRATGPGRGVARTALCADGSAKLHDKQSERDHRELRIDKVGVRGLRFPIQVRDKARAVQNTVATIGMFVDLPKEFKGTHMSRFVEVLNAHGNVIHVENITDILYALQKKLNAATSHLEIEFPYFMSKQSPVSRKESLMDYIARFDAAACAQEIDFVLTVKAHRDDAVPVLEGDCQIRRAQPARAGDGADPVRASRSGSRT